MIERLADVPARNPGAVPVPERPARDAPGPRPHQGRGLRRRGRHAHRRHGRRHPRPAGAARAAPMGLLLPLSVRDRLLRRPAVLRQPEEGGASANRAGPRRRGQRARRGHRRVCRVRPGRGAGCRCAVGRDDPVGRARHRSQRHRGPADPRGREGQAGRQRAPGRRHHLRLRRLRPDPVSHVARPEDPGRRPPTRGEAARRTAVQRVLGRWPRRPRLLRGSRLSRREFRACGHDGGCLRAALRQRPAFGAASRTGRPEGDGRRRPRPCNVAIASSCRRAGAAF